jgi:hypothetical protein
MQTIGPLQAAHLILQYPAVARFGTGVRATEENRIEQAEFALGFQLPKSYKWFLSTYACGDICGDEIYSIYGHFSDRLICGDLVLHHILAGKSDPSKQKKLVIHETAAGEVFYFDCSSFDNDECPIMLAGEVDIKYGSKFYEFLFKRIHANVAPKQSAGQGLEGVDTGCRQGMGGA